MAIDRRNLILGLAAAPFIGRVHAAESGDVPFDTVACARIDGRDHAVLLDDGGAVRAVAELPSRGHGGAFHPDGRHTVVFARRPGEFAFVIDRSTGAADHVFRSPSGRHFYGHGAYSRDGRLLYSTENDYDGERGVIGIWDAADGYARVGEFDSFGIGPHDMALMPDGHTLVVANGGILTHPETGRHKLNIPEMEPSLVMLDMRTGERTGQWSLPRELHKLSIRHLARTHDGGVAAAMQYEGPAGDTPPLVLRLGRDGLQPMAATVDVQRRMKNYAGAIASDATGKMLAVSAPRGGLVTFWTDEGAYLSSFDIADGCGVVGTSLPGEFILSGGGGRLVHYWPVSRLVVSDRRVSGYSWDNHMTAAHPFGVPL